MNHSLAEALRAEFLQEAESTRKLLKAIPDSALSYRPSDHSWTTAQLASHIATIYFWHQGVLLQDTLDMATLRYEREDYSKAGNIVAKFEENFAGAKAGMDQLTDESLGKTWRMTQGGQDVLPPMPRLQAIRGFLMNHLYHHRGELVIYLRATGNRVPGLYGPTWEDSQRQAAQ